MSVKCMGLTSSAVIRRLVHTSLFEDAFSICMRYTGNK